MIRILSALILFFASLATSSAAQPETKFLNEKWAFEGVFGKFDRASVQRGYQVYKQVCSACHSMKRIYYRNLQEIGFSEAEVKQIASEYLIPDGPNDEGEMFDRAGLPSDHFKSPYPNEQSARNANGGALPPDLSLIIKARENGANYVYSLLNGYEKAPKDHQVPEGKYYNKYFAAGNYNIGMLEPLQDGLVQYQDGTATNKKQLAKDVVNFLQWAAEPEMEERKAMGLKVMLFTLVFTIIFFLAKKRIWSRLEK